ncbi:MAG: dihydroorotate dehydrogenase [Firmicutes bacterium]|nr:dihydroorotate dehydrogenase [Bacillota bacterium]
MNDMDKIEMGVHLCDVHLKNPVIAASGTVGFCDEYQGLIDFSKVGAVSLKGLTLQERAGNEGVRICETASGMLNSIGLQNPGIDAFLMQYLPKIQALDTVLIANIAGNCMGDYVEMARRLANVKAIKMLELNISCPNVKQGGVAFGVYPKDIGRIVRAVKKVCKQPLMVKLSPNVASICDNAKAAQDAGADCLSLVNTVHGLAVDLDKACVIVKGGLSGPAIKPIGLRQVYEVCKAVDIPVVGMGGIKNAKDALEYIACGATAVQIGTAIFSQPSVLQETVSGIQEYLRKKGLNNISQIKGVIK